MVNAVRREIETRIMHKHDIEENWMLASELIPLSGELIIYDVDATHPAPRFKVGDGITKVSNLPFVSKYSVGLSNVDNTSDLNKPVSLAQNVAINQAMSEVGSELAAHTSRIDNPHSVTKAQLGLSNVEDKSSSTIRAELTKDNVTTALGYTPPTKDTKYTHPTSSGNKHIPSGGSFGQILRWSADGTAIWENENDTTYSNATTATAGLMSKEDKSKLDAIDAGANAYAHPSYTAITSKPTANQTPAFGGTITISQIKSDATGHVTSATDRTITIPETLSNGTGTAGLIKTSSTVTSSDDYTACPVIDGVPYYKDTVSVDYSVATTAANGLMSAADKTKLDATNIAYGTCDTAAATAEKLVIISGNSNWTLTTGSIIMVKFSKSNLADNVKLNVNNTGAYPIWYNNAAYVGSGSAYTGYAGRTTTYVFNGNYWVWISSSYDADTQNSISSADTSGKIFLVGATSQGSNKATYSHDTVYAGEDGHVYSNNKQVVNLSDSQALTNKTYNGYTLGAACAKGVDTSITSGSASLITSGAVYTALAGKSDTTHTHSYAGSASIGGSATSAVKLDTATAGSATQPVYFTGGKPAACTYTLGASVPSDAKFTDTVYTLPAATSSTLGGVKVGSNISLSSGTISLTKDNVTAALGYTPQEENTKVTNTLATTTKAYVTGTSTSTTNTGTQVFDTGVYLDTTAGRLTATSYKVGNAVISYDSSKGLVITVS